MRNVRVVENMIVVSLNGIDFPMSLDVARGYLADIAEAIDELESVQPGPTPEAIRAIREEAKKDPPCQHCGVPRSVWDANRCRSSQGHSAVEFDGSRVSGPVAP